METSNFVILVPSPSPICKCLPIVSSVENPELSKVPSLKPGVGQDIALSLKPGVGQDIAPSLKPGVGQNIAPSLKAGVGQDIAPSLKPEVGQNIALQVSAMPVLLPNFWNADSLNFNQQTKETRALDRQGTQQQRPE